MKFQFDSTPFEKILKEYAALREVEIPTAVAINARLLCVELARRTQPFGVKPDAGLERVKNDITKIIKYPVHVLKMISQVENQKIRNRLRVLYSNQRWDVIARIFSNIGYLKKWGEFQSLDGIQQIKATHKKNRKPRTGRTNNRADALYITNSSNLDKYIKEVQSRVGLSKGGWAACALALPSVVKGRMTRGIPNWVVKAAKQNGRIENRLANKTNPEVKLTNTTPWADRICGPYEVAKATSVVVAKMKNQMKQILLGRQRAQKAALAGA
jgi:hypothetical protein